MYAGSVIQNRSGSVLPPLITVTDTCPVPADLTDNKISSVRRTFSLFVLFDLILIFILWVIYTQLFGETGFNAFVKQVNNYSFKTSLFDTVMLSAGRFALLILAYAVFRLRHWWIIAMSTSLSCAFLIAKIFLFDFEGTKSSSNPLSYCLIIISFVLAWLETWFLDFKVLPHEKKLRERITAGHNTGYGSNLIGHRVHFPGGDDIQSIITEDNNQYYSPLDSPEGSDIEQDDNGRTSTGQDTNYVKVARYSWEVLKSYISSPETEWKLECDSVGSGGIVHSRNMTGLGKVYRLKAVIDMPPVELYEELISRPEQQTSWHSAIKASKVLQVVNDHTDIVYNIFGETAGGVITQRDFVSVRTWGSWDDGHMGSWMAVNHQNMPPRKHYVRGVNGPSGWVFKPLPGDSRRTLFFCYVITDIKGSFPHKLIDTNMIKLIEDFCKDLHAHVKTITNC